MNNYISCGFLFIRGAWFLDFLSSILDKIVNKRAISLKVAGCEAYDEALATHHPWVLQKVIKVGLGIITTRE